MSAGPFKATRFFLSASMHLKNPAKEELLDLTNFLYRMNPANKMSMTYVFLHDEKYVDMKTVYERLDNLKLVHKMSLNGWNSVNPDIEKALKELK